jgi:predicted RNase H-like HicB family nuclease
MKLQIVVHEAEEGGYWAEVPAIPGCATQGKTIEELLKNVREAVEACLAVSVDLPSYGDSTRVMEIAF